jgi:hypothetical protein
MARGRTHSAAHPGAAGAGPLACIRRPSIWPLLIAMGAPLLPWNDLDQVLHQLTGALVELLNLNWPPWIGNLANVVQLLSSGLAVATVLAIRRRRARPHGRD